MQTERLDVLRSLLHTHSEIEEGHLAGVHGKRSYAMAYDKTRDAYDFSWQGGPYTPAIEIIKHERFSETPSHYHKHIELVFMLSGQCVEVIDGQELLLTPDVVSLVDTNTVHALGYTGEDDLLLNVVLNKEYFAQRFLSGLTQSSLLTTFFVNALNSSSSQLNYLVFNVGGNGRLKDMLAELAYEAFFPSPNHDEMLDQLFYLVLLDMIGAIDERIAYQRLGKGSKMVADALSIIDRRYLDCTLEEVAREVGASSSYLTTKLKRETGRGFSEIVVAKRMDYARDMLLTTDAPIEHVIRACGYENLTYFYRKFRERHGRTPNQLRKEMKTHALYGIRALQVQ